MQQLRVEIFCPKGALEATDYALLDYVLLMAGGHTTIDAQGAWTNPRTDQVHYEPTQVVLFFLPDTPENLLAVETICRDFKEASGEQCVMYVLNGNDVYYVED